MRITDNFRNIPEKYFYVRVKRFFIYDTTPAVLQYLPSLFSEGESNAYVLQTGKINHCFIFSKDFKNLEYFKTDSINEVLMEYPLAVIEKIRN